MPPGTPRAVNADHDDGWVAADFLHDASSRSDDPSVRVA
jgi:hypothetical protein